jgi:hypothetical protein
MIFFQKIKKNFKASIYGNLGIVKLLVNARALLETTDFQCRCTALMFG